MDQDLSAQQILRKLEEQRKQLQEKKKILQEKDKILQEKDKILQEKDKKLEELREENARKTINQLLKKIPTCHILPFDLTSTSVANHMECELKDGIFKLLPNFDELVKLNGHNYSCLLGYLCGKESFEIRTEYELYFYVQTLLEDAIRLCGLESELKVISQREVVNLQSDFWVIKLKDSYVGTFEAKKTENELKDPRAIGQIFDNLMGISFSFAKRESFSILTNFVKTQILFTEDSLDSAAGNQYIQSNNVEKSPTKTTEPVKSTGNLKVKREIYASQVIDYKDPIDLFQLICSALFKMKECHHDERKEGTRMTLCMDSDHAKAEPIEIDVKKGLTDLNTLQPDLLKKVYLLKNLGGGGDGFCWFGITQNGDPLAIKSFKDNNRSKIEQESQLWYTIWDIKTIVMNYVKKIHLVMPYIKPISSKDLINEETFKILAKEACDRFAEKGYKHHDLYIRHISKIKEGATLKYIFIDLSRVSVITNKEKASRNMFKEIMKDFSLQNIQPTL